MNEETDRIEGLDRLTRSRAPSRDLWPGIAARLATRRRSRYGLVQFALAASLVAGMAGVFTVSLQQQAGPAGGLQVAALPLEDHSRAIVEANLSIVRQSERQLRQALKQNPHSTTLRSLLASTENRQRALTALL
ncbi:MAG: hypothetical protein ACT4PK_07430 [Gammaproteobacteria bacterium]